MAEGSAASLQQWLAQEANAVRARLEVFDPQAADPDTPPPPLGRVGEGARGELEWLRRAEWVSHRTGVRWSGSDDELKKAWTRQLQRLRDARRIRPDDSTRRMEERRASATQRAAANGARDARRDAAAQQRAAQRRAQLAQQKAERREIRRRSRVQDRARTANALRRILLEAQWLRVIMLDNVDGDILNSYTWCAQGKCTRPNYGKLSKAKVLLLDSDYPSGLGDAVWHFFEFPGSKCDPLGLIRRKYTAPRDYPFKLVRNIDGRKGLDRYVRVITDDEDEDDVKREVDKLLTRHMPWRTFEHVDGRVNGGVTAFAFAHALASAAREARPARLRLRTAAMNWFARGAAAQRALEEFDPAFADPDMPIPNDVVGSMSSVMKRLGL